MRNLFIRIISTIILLVLTISLTFDIIMTQENYFIIVRMILFLMVLYVVYFVSVLVHEYAHFFYAKRQGYKLLKTRIYPFKGANIILNFHEYIIDDKTCLKVLKDIKKMFLMGPLMTASLLLCSIMCYWLDIIPMVTGAMIIINVSIIFRSIYINEEWDIQDIYTYFHFDKQISSIYLAILSQSMCEDKANGYIVSLLVKSISLQLIREQVFKEQDELKLMILLVYIYDKKLQNEYKIFVELLNKKFDISKKQNMVYSFVCICLIICINVELQNFEMAYNLYEHLEHEEMCKWIVLHTEYRYYYDEVLSKLKKTLYKNKEDAKYKVYKKMGLRY